VNTSVASVASVEVGSTITDSKAIDGSTHRHAETDRQKQRQCGATSDDDDDDGQHERQGGERRAKDLACHVKGAREGAVPSRTRGKAREGEGRQVTPHSGFPYRWRPSPSCPPSSTLGQCSPPPASVARIRMQVRTCAHLSFDPTLR
jgi:hypothetical protein